MSIGFNEAYDTYMVQDNESYYREFAQSSIDFMFNDSTLVRTVKEENYPFNGEYTEYQCHVDTISDVSVNTTKVSGNYLSLIFKDCSHKNRRGQKYLYEDKPYLCFDKTEDLSEISRTKIIKCNNKISWIDKTSGKIITEPIFIGFELSATNSNTTKDSTVEQRRLICLIQGNEYTKDIVENQRFLLSKNKAFKVTQSYDINLDDINEEYSSIITLYIEWSTVSPQDNTTLLVADYYQYDYKLSINSTDLSLSNGATGQLTSTILLNDAETTNVPIQWSTSDVRVVTIDSQGNYHVIGESGSTASITCSIVGHTEVSDSIDLSVVAMPVVVKELIVSPSGTISLLQNREQTITYGVYANGVLQSDVVTVSPSGANTSNYTIVYGVNSLTVKNVLKSTTSLTLTFTSDLMSQVVTIKLGGVI